MQDKLESFINSLPTDDWHTYLVIALMIVFFILLIVIVAITSYKTYKSCVKFSNKTNIEVLNTFHIVIFGVVIAYIYCKDKVDGIIQQFFTNFNIDNILLVISVVLFFLPIIINIARCKIKFGLKYTYVQVVAGIVLGLIIGTVIYLAIAIILLSLFLTAGGGNSDASSGIWVVDRNGNRFRIRQTSVNRAVDTEGNHYERNGDYYYDENMNSFRIIE